MKIFISWSGERSGQLGAQLATYLRCIVPGATTFLSTSDVRSGELWHRRVASELRDCRFGLLCFTQDNLDSQWILFEAGALAHHLDGRICAVLFDELSPGDIPSPLSHYQHRRFTMPEIRLLASDLSKEIPELDPGILDMTFDKWWPDLQENCAPYLRAGAARKIGRLDRLWRRERDASEVWVVSPELHHDILNRDCKTAVMLNRKRGVRYRYIVPATDLIAKRMPIYATEFGLQEQQLAAEFLCVPANEPDLVGFLVELVMYDPHTDSRAAYGYPPSSHHNNDDIIELGPGLSAEYMRHFEAVWTRRRMAPP